MKFDRRRRKPVEEAVVAEVVRLALIELQLDEARRHVETHRLARVSALLNANRIKSILYVAKLVVDTEETFDAHPDLLNVVNGVVNLRDGSLGPNDPTLVLTKVTTVDYRPGAYDMNWREALTALPADATDWLQVRMGQALTGYPVLDDRLVVLKGSGANGKTTLIDGVRAVLGEDYAVTMPDRVLLARPGDHPTELMFLRGARVALMEEFPSWAI